MTVCANEPLKPTKTNEVRMIARKAGLLIFNKNFFKDKTDPLIKRVRKGAT
jgi:hypothetical protein